VHPAALAVVQVARNFPTTLTFEDIYCPETHGISSGKLYPILTGLEKLSWLETRWQESKAGGRPPRHLCRLSGTAREWAREEELRAAEEIHVETGGRKGVSVSPQSHPLSVRFFRWLLSCAARNWLERRHFRRILEHSLTGTGEECFPGVESFVGVSISFCTNVNHGFPVFASVEIRPNLKRNSHAVNSDDTPLAYNSSNPFLIIAGRLGPCERISCHYSWS
jgi:DNA-binding PadR family transcriptional regulator